MKMMRSLVAVSAVAGVPLSVVLADRPPANVKPVVEVVEHLEQRGYGPFVEVSFDDAYWEVEVYKDGGAYELAVDGNTGQVMSEHRDDAERRPPRDAKALSRVLRALDEAGYTSIEEVEFERRYWEIEALRTDGKHEILVDPVTGEVVNDRRDH